MIKGAFGVTLYAKPLSLPPCRKVTSPRHPIQDIVEEFLPQPEPQPIDTSHPLQSRLDEFFANADFGWIDRARQLWRLEPHLGASDLIELLKSAPAAQRSVTTLRMAFYSLGTFVCLLRTLYA